MAEKLTGKIFDIQGFSTQDGPGIRTTFFFKGCPLHCPWCHSPESQAFHSQLTFMSEKCFGTKRCNNACISLCPEEAISYGSTRKDLTSPEMLQMISIDHDKCTDCGKCTEKCYPKALSLCGQDYTLEEALKAALKDRVFYDKSCGGVTLSGGECMSQFEFVFEFVKSLKENGISTAIDTTGHVAWKKLEAILPYTDLFLYDLKHMDNEKHRLITGVPNETILSNAKKLAAAGAKLQIRIPVIPGFNNGQKNMKETAVFCQSLGPAVTQIQLLPYHNMGTVKYLMLDEHAKVFEATPPTDEEMQRHKKVFEDAGLKATIH